MAIELLKAEDIGEDLNEIKRQIDELEASREAHMATARAELLEVEAIDANLKTLRNKGEIILGTKVDRSEGKAVPSRERVETPPEVDTEKTP